MISPKSRRTVSALFIATAVLSTPTACSSSPATPAAANSVSATAADQVGGGDIPDTQAFVSTTIADGRATLRVPEGWSRTQAGTSIRFSDKYNSIDIESAPTAKPPTTASITITDAAALAAQPGYTPGRVTTVDRAAGTAVLSTYTADSPPNAVTGKSTPEAVERYDFYRSGTQITLTLAAPTGSDNVDPWRTVTDSLTWLP